MCIQFRLFRVWNVSDSVAGFVHLFHGEKIVKKKIHRCDNRHARDTKALENYR